MKHLFNAIGMAVLCLLALPVIADNNHKKHEHSADNSHSDRHGVHQHGVAQLLVIKELTDLQLELRSPAANLLGFEHVAQTREERAAVAVTRQKLMKAQALFVFDSDNCKLQHVKIDTAAVDESTVEHRHHPETAVTDHGDITDDSDVTGHGGIADHGDIVAVYRYQCQQNAKIESLGIEMLVQFPGITMLEVQAMVDGQQQAMSLDKKNRIINF